MCFIERGVEACPWQWAPTALWEADMLHTPRILHAVLRTSCRPVTGVVVLALLLVGHATWADDQPGARAVRLLKTIPIPGTTVNMTNGKLYSFDISFVNPSTQTYYLADRSNVAVDVVDAKTAAFIGQIAVDPPFAGFVPTATCTAAGGRNCSGPNGVVAAYPWLFVTDGGSRVVTIDLRTCQSDLRTCQIAPGGDVVTAANDINRADELAYAPELGLLLVINPNEAVPFGTFISVDTTTGTLTVGQRITFPAATNGAEQPVWNPADGRFYLSIPSISGTTMTPGPTGAVYRIDPNTGTVETAAVIDQCGPAGLTLGPNQELLVGCNTVYDVDGNVWDPTKDITANPREVILDAPTGIITAIVFGVGAGDEVWFNPGDGHYYVTGSGSPLRPTLSSAAQGASVLGVIDAVSRSVEQLVPTFNVPAVGTGNTSTEHPAGTAHSVAANAENNLVFVPLGANNVFPDCLTGCIAVYGRLANNQD